jgi:cytosine/adenosine deaminase-related metal-dependent hydrolase
MRDLVLRGGRIIDPMSGRDETADIAFGDGKVTEIGRDLPAGGAEIVDVRGLLVVPGLIDLHTHVYWGGTSLGVDAVEVARRSGTTTFVDAGSAGKTPPGALWSHGSIEASRLRSAPEMTRVVVAIDPAVTSGDEADETGIVVAGKDKNGHGYVLADISGRYPPTEWAHLAITAYRTHRADRIVAEVNNGGDMVGATLRMVDPNVAFTAVRASRGKVVRAEPVAAL